jgi:hypothetical protein
MGGVSVRGPQQGHDDVPGADMLISAGLAGYGMEWLLEDPSSLFDILQPHNAPSEPVPPASADQTLDPSFLNTLLNQVRSMGYGPTADLSQTRRTTSSAESGGHRAILPPSRAATPPIEAGDEDKWRK